MSPRSDHPDLARHHLLVVSDLHLSEGCRPATNKYSTREDFFFDHEFARFLAYYRGAGRADGVRWHLIINGDMLDFLQVTAYQDAPPELRRASRHLRYGLDCGEPETVYKMGKIAEGHPELGAHLSVTVRRHLPSGILPEHWTAVEAATSRAGDR